MSILDIKEIKPLKDYIESNLINTDIKGTNNIDDYTKAPTVVQTIFDKLLNISDQELCL